MSPLDNLRAIEERIQANFKQLMETTYVSCGCRSCQMEAGMIASIMAETDVADGEDQ